MNPETRTKLLETAGELFSDAEKIELIVFGGDEEGERQNAINAGINTDVLQVSTTDSIDSVGAISREATDYDIVCMVEQQQALHGLIFGDKGGANSQKLLESTSCYTKHRVERRGIAYSEDILIR